MAEVKVYKVKPVETWADLEKKIEIEVAYLMYDGATKDKAFEEAKEYVYSKYPDVVAKLKSK